MKCDKVILALFCIVSSTQLYKADKVHNTKRNFISSRENQRYDEPWSWGFVDVTESTSQEPQSQATDETEENPCLRTTPPMPDFSAVQRRISEQKCYEYIWEIKLRQIKSKNDKECIDYLIKHRGPNGPYFAIGGYDAAPGEFPHMGAIGWKAAVGTWIFKCGCSLLSEKFTLTAAHCTKASPADTTIADPVPKIVRLGDKNIIDGWSNGYLPVTAEIKRIIVHPKYKSPRKYYDIAVMELKEPVGFNENVQPACLWHQFDTSSLGPQATLTGWGVIETGGRTTSPDLQAAVVDVVDSTTCDELLRPMCNRLWCGIQDHQICAGKLAGGVDACQGDSGGPLQVKIPGLPNTDQGVMHYVIGITSFGFGCAIANTPGVYTRVSPFVDWIEDIVWS